MAAIGDKSHPVFINAKGQAQVCDSIAGGGGSTVVGSIVPYCGTDTPDGFFPCDGREISRESYADLYAVIGDTFGTATDPLKFKLPKIDDARYLQGNTTPGQEKSEELPNIKGTTGHSLQTVSSDVQSPTGAFSGSTQTKNGAGSSTSDKVKIGLDFDASKSNAVYKDGGAVQPKSVTVRYLICWKKTIAKVDAMVGMPDWNPSNKTFLYSRTDSTVSKDLLTSGTGWTCEENGFIHVSQQLLIYRFDTPQASSLIPCALTVNGVPKDAYGVDYCYDSDNKICGITDTQCVAVHGLWSDAVIPVSKGDVVKLTNNDTRVTPTAIAFYPAKATPAKLTELYMGTPDWDNVVGLKPHYTTEPYRFTITKDGWLEVGFYDPDNTMPDNSVKEWAVTVNGQSASWHSVGKTAGAYNTDAQLTMVPVASGDIAELILPAAGAANDGRYYAVVYFVPRKKIQIDTSDIIATGGGGVIDGTLLEPENHIGSFSKTSTRKFLYEVKNDCFLVIVDRSLNEYGTLFTAGDTTNVIGSISCVHVSSTSTLDSGSIGAPIKKGTRIYAASISGSSETSDIYVYEYKLTALAPQIAMPDYSKSAIVDKTESFEVSENGYLLIDLTHGSGWDTGNTGGEVEVGSYGIWNWSRGARASSGGSDWNDKQSCVVPVSKGDQVTITQGDTNVATIHCKLIPCKIVQQTNDAPYVVERKRGTNTDGSTWWYTLWSDKWCEQGGLCKTYNSSSTDYELTLPKAYADTDYTVTATPTNHTESGRAPSDRIDALISSTSMVYFLTWKNESAAEENPHPVFWRAEGYVA